MFVPQNIFNVNITQIITAFQPKFSFKTIVYPLGKVTQPYFFLVWQRSVFCPLFVFSWHFSGGYKTSGPPSLNESIWLLFSMQHTKGFYSLPAIRVIFPTFKLGANTNFNLFKLFSVWCAHFSRLEVVISQNKLKQKLGWDWNMITIREFQSPSGDT